MLGLDDDLLYSQLTIAQSGSDTVSGNTSDEADEDDEDDTIDDIPSDISSGHGSSKGSRTRRVPAGENSLYDAYEEMQKEVSTCMAVVHKER